MEDETKNQVHVSALLVLLGSLIYCYFLVKKNPKRHFETHTPLLLRPRPSISLSPKLPRFCLYFYLSIKIKNNFSPKQPPLFLTPLTKLFLGTILPIFILFYSITLENNSLIFILFLYGLITLAWLYKFGTMARYHPYFATSLQDFWGRRWNQMSSDILCQSVYDPTRESLAGIIGFGPAKVVAVIMTLVVSGAMHELIFYYITCGRKPTWEMAWFFVLHGLCMVTDAGLKRLAEQKGWAPVNPAVSIVLTVGFATVTGFWLLVLPVWRSSQGECRFK